VHALRIGGIREEEDFTSQMLSAVRSGLVRVRLDGFQWDSSVVKKQTEEPKIGADFAGVLRVRRDGYQVDKGFLAQAKLAGPHKRIVKSKLLVQAEAMLEISAASFVFLYRPTGVSVVPAISVVANRGEPRDLIEWNFGDFLLEHFRSLRRRSAPWCDWPTDSERCARRAACSAGHLHGPATRLGRAGPRLIGTRRDTVRARSRPLLLAQRSSRLVGLAPQPSRRGAHSIRWLATATINLWYSSSTAARTTIRSGNAAQPLIAIEAPTGTRSSHCPLLDYNQTRLLLQAAPPRVNPVDRSPVARRPVRLCRAEVRGVGAASESGACVVRSRSGIMTPMGE
jgi:hypothetical protein